jgi:hypothetical protein
LLSHCTFCATSVSFGPDENIAHVIRYPPQKGIIVPDPVAYVLGTVIRLEVTRLHIVLKC